MKNLENRHWNDSCKRAAKEFDLYSFRQKFMLRFRENRKEKGLIRAFLSAFRRNDLIDLRIKD